jgi:integrase
MGNRIAATKREYYKRSIQLMAKAYREAESVHHHISSNPVNIKYEDQEYTTLGIKNTAKWARKYWSHEKRPNTWRKYRSSFIYYAEIKLSQNKITQDDYEEIIEILNSSSGGDKKQLEHMTSSNKKKSISEDDLKIIDSALSKSKNKWSDASRLWVRGGIITGLRPIEWPSSEIIENDNGIFMIINNAKNTNGRSIGKTRTLNLNHLSKNEVSIVKQNIIISKKFHNENQWTKYYQGCSNVLRYTLKKVFSKNKKSISLYSARHQYAANMKASKCSPREVAALMGHASDYTNQAHYGKKRVGKNLVKPEINKNDLSKVKKNVKKSDFKFKK